MDWRKMKLHGWQWLWLSVSILFGCLAARITVETYPDRSWADHQYAMSVSGLTIASLEVERYLAKRNGSAKVVDDRPITQKDVEARIAKATAERDRQLAELSGLRRAHVVRSVLKWSELSAGLYLLCWAMAAVRRSLNADRAAKQKPM
jgi:hypothetical protein